jgi:segregation and condensation protein A
MRIAGSDLECGRSGTVSYGRAMSVPIDTPTADGRSPRVIPDEGSAAGSGGVPPADAPEQQATGVPGHGGESTNPGGDRSAIGAVMSTAGGHAGPDSGDPGAERGGTGRSAQFQVRLTNFEGPFDLLLHLIAKHQLDVTEVALSQVTDDFIAHIRALGADWDLGQATEFLVVAATLLDLKAARLLPAAAVEDEEDLALLEARDLLFARLLQYRAYKQAVRLFSELIAGHAHRHPRAVELETRFADLLPEVLLGVGPEQFARIAARALAPKPVPTVSVDHIHAPKVSVREHAIILRERLARLGSATFRALTQDCQHTLEVVARFLALLELYREAAVAFDQVTALGELHVRWTGSQGDTPQPESANDIDEEYG